MAIGVEGWAIVTRQLVVICLLFKQVMASFFRLMLVSLGFVESFIVAEGTERTTITLGEKCLLFALV